MKTLNGVAHNCLGAGVESEMYLCSSAQFSVMPRTKAVGVCSRRSATASAQWL